MNKYLKLAIISGAVILADQVTKAMVSGGMDLYESIEVIPGFFSLTRLHNPGGAFSFLAGQSPMVRQVVFLALPLAAVLLLVYFYKKSYGKSSPVFSLALALITGGAVGNLIDRIRLEYVIDFLDFYIKGMHWPPFNVADSAISVGMAVFAFHVLFKNVKL